MTTTSKTIHSSLNVKDNFSISKNDIDVLKTETDKITIDEKTIDLKSGASAQLIVTETDLEIKFGTNLITVNDGSIRMVKGAHSMTVNDDGVFVSKLVDGSHIVASGVSIPVNGVDTTTTTAAVIDGGLYKFTVTSSEGEDGSARSYTYGVFSTDGTTLTMVEQTNLGDATIEVSQVDGGFITLKYSEDISGNYQNVNVTHNVVVTKM